MVCTRGSNYPLKVSCVKARTRPHQECTDSGLYIETGQSSEFKSCAVFINNDTWPWYVTPAVFSTRQSKPAGKKRVFRAWPGGDLLHAARPGSRPYRPKMDQQFYFPTTKISSKPGPPPRPPRRAPCWSELAGGVAGAAPAGAGAGSVVIKII
jgi:hypothetical protein